jgi:hypothetical protein
MGKANKADFTNAKRALFFNVAMCLFKIALRRTLKAQSLKGS